MVEYNLTHPNSEYSGSPDFGGSRQYSSTKARFRTSDLSVCNPGPTAHLKNKMPRPASVYKLVMTSRSNCGSGWDDPLPIVNQMVALGVHVRTVAQQLIISVVP